MSRYIIRRLRLAHCKRGPAMCLKCRQMDVQRLCLLDTNPPDQGQVQRRVIQVRGEEGQVWREFDVVRAFDSEEEAERYAAEHGIADVDLGPSP